MRITEVKVHCAQMSCSWLTETTIANPMSVYPKYKERRSSWYGRMVAGVVELQTDEGLNGLGFIGGGKAHVASLIIEDQLKTFLIDQDPFNSELIWEQMYRASAMYGRRGVVIEAISGIDIALWDLMGKALGQPVYNLIGGRTKEKIRAYVTGNFVERYVKEGFHDVKIALPYGPADREDGLRKNEELVKRARELVGTDGEIMLDCYMALDVPYAIELIRRLRDYKIKWIEEPLPPDQIEGYLRIKEAWPDVLLAGGEHEYTRYGFKELVERRAVDILQPDIYRAGGVSELKKIAALASANDLAVIPHGIGSPTYHFVMATVNAPCAEFVDVFAQGGELLLEGEPVAARGYIELTDAPGFGYKLNERALRGEAPIAPIW